ncbi:peroxiredoxin family protein [Pseudohoeflea coraliihabitans]|uniref:Redoxin family protein n=1 Tax=Pseudohoeflea coraliihabitans TaxID=2860393 RepID=A0ABS6WM75_9HYPH|nr:redoxin domain-containing protein [Pseudohoeflea sp. DP4N28-3]MBW3097036.1 redoxin family protein [Pseudohoeflea sp. DP4N28-3]
MSAALGRLLAEPQVSSWLNVHAPVTLSALRGRVVMIVTFQMLCPGCVAHALPQAQRVARSFAASEVAVVGLHTVFEHHAAMQEVSLRAFLHEYRIAFPVAIDQPGSGAIPCSMQAYGLRGTPSLLLIDRDGILRAHHFGEVPDLVLGAEIAGLMAQNGVRRTSEDSAMSASGREASACVRPPAD